MNPQQLEPCTNISMSQEEFTDIVDKAKDWTLIHGIGMRSKQNFNRNAIEIIPFTLLPSSFPRQEFYKVKNLQTLLNELVHKVSHDYEFIKSSLKCTIEVDPFTAKLFNIYEIVYKEGFNQNISLGLCRSDYMLHNYSTAKQVEFNTVASSFSGLATIISQYHRYMLMELEQEDKLKNIPSNNSLNGFSNGLIRAWDLYGNNKAVVLFVVEDVTYNICDQRYHEFEIRRLNPAVKVIRKTLTSLVKDAKLSSKKELIVDDYIVAVVYYRTGYELEAYPSENEWSVRLLIERSRAIKCPSIQYHLAGTKKIQQSLSSPKVLSRFLEDENVIAKVQEVFTGLYSLDFDESGENAIKMALAEPNKFVLKPQREGGGYNMFGEDIRNLLNSIKDSKERMAWILMDLIQSSVQKNYIVRTGYPEGNNIHASNVVVELGVYGVIIGDHNKIIVNEEVGHVLRTKPSNLNEGGIVAGFGALDSPYLIDP